TGPPGRGQRQRHQVVVDVARVVEEEPAREPGYPRRDGEAEDLHPGDIDPDHRRRDLVLLDRAELGAELRALEEVEKDHDDDQGEQDDPEVLERGNSTIVDVADVAEALAGVRPHHAIADPPRVTDVEASEQHDLAESEGGAGARAPAPAMRGD